MRKRVSLILTMVFVSGVLLLFLFNKEKTAEPFAAEEFIKKWLKNDNGTLATYMKEEKAEDEDFVKGREALSETLGLWMEYALQKEDKKLFEESYKTLNRYFLEEDGFVYWKLTESGQSRVSANALVDDLRISLALFQAKEKWNEERYEKAAVRISEYIVEFNNYQHVLTDFYERNDQYASPIITLSYIEPESLKKLQARHLIDGETYKNMLKILKNAPNDGVFYPKKFNVKSKKYLFDQNVNMIDQALVAFYRAKSGFSTTLFSNFIKKEIDTHGVIFGQYNRVTGQPAVEYESPAIYGWLILYCVEIGEEELAKILFKEMNKFQNTDSDYYGGYSVYKEDTHIFDNLVPLLAERKLYNKGLIN
ncbi:glycosyl hydrolase family 8 [Bacillus sp. B190/17]|uniref:Glycosyl hydrolase family 8 n=1 Tax=Bacillus lumedeiriae TaxID=3058829 RepID=A0ABW8IAB4_9BACI